MTEWLSILLLAAFCGTGVPGYSGAEQHVEPLISQEPKHEDWRDLFALGSPSAFGVEGPLEHPHAWITPVVVVPGPEHGVIVLEDNTADIKLVLPDGEVRAFGHGKGSGPGEFRDLFGAAWSRELGILIADGPNRRITQFQEDGSYVGDIHPNVSYYRIAVSGRHLWMSTFGPTPDRAYLLDASSGEVLTEVGGRYESEPWAGRLGILGWIVADGDHVLISVSYPYEVQRYDTEGRLRGVFGRVVNWLGPPEELDLGAYGKSVTPEGGMIGDIAVLPEVGYMVRIARREWVGTYSNGLPRSESTPYFDVFSREGVWLTTIPGQDLLPRERIGPWTIASDRAFWCIVFGDYYRLIRLPIYLK